MGGVKNYMMDQFYKLEPEINLEFMVIQNIILSAEMPLECFDELYDIVTDSDIMKPAATIARYNWFSGIVFALTYKANCEVR